MKLFSFLVLFVFFFASGYWIGLHPEYYDEYLSLINERVVLYIEDTSLINESMQKELKLLSETNVIFETKKIEIADILLANYKSVKQLCPIRLTAFNQEIWNRFNSSISPDFQIAKLKDCNMLPVAWRQSNGNLEVQVLFLNQRVRKKKKSEISLARILFNTQFQKMWLATNEWSTTLLSLEESNLPENKKASFIKKLPLTILN